MLHLQPWMSDTEESPFLDPALRKRAVKVKHVKRREKKSEKKVMERVKWMWEGRGQGLNGARARRGGMQGETGVWADFYCPDLPCPIEGREIQAASAKAEAQGQMETPRACRCQRPCVTPTVPGTWLCAPCPARLQVLLRRLWHEAGSQVSHSWRVQGNKGA